MHRMELKGMTSIFATGTSKMVPNAPYGVESTLKLLLKLEKQMFLMHRMELKAFTRVLMIL